MRKLPANYQRIHAETAQHSEQQKSTLPAVKRVKRQHVDVKIEGADENTTSANSKPMRNRDHQQIRVTAADAPDSKRLNALIPLKQEELVIRRSTRIRAMLSHGKKS